MLLDIVILPPAKLRERIGQAVLRATRGVACKYVIDNEKLIPHVSLFHIRTSKLRLAELSKIVREIAGQYKPFKIKSKGVRVGNPLYFWLSNDKNFKKIHRDTVLKSYHLRTGEMPWTSTKLPTKLESYFRKKYGTQHVLGLKSPHFTLVRLKNKADSQMVARRLSSFKFEFIASEVAICEVNFWHQVTRILKRFRV